MALGPDKQLEMEQIIRMELNLELQLVDKQRELDPAKMYPLLLLQNLLQNILSLSLSLMFLVLLVVLSLNQLHMDPE